MKIMTKKLRNGALGEFTLASSGGGSTDAIISITGLFTDEWLHSGTFLTRFQAESRNVLDDNGTVNGIFVRMQRARNSLESTVAKLEAAPDAANDPRVGELYMYAGFTYLAFAENYCNGVPFSFQPDEGDTQFGPPETGNEIFDRAIARFQSAIGAGAVAADVADAARVGMGRAMLGKADFAGAASAVSAVADDFVKLHRHSANSAAQRNGIFELNVTVGRWSLGDTEGVNGLDFRTANDPRITSTLCAGCAFDTSGQVPGTPAAGDNWSLTNYGSRDDDVRLATGIEARLIEAEAQLATNPGGWLTMLNDLRTNWATLASSVSGDGTVALDPLTDPGTQAAREDLHFRERAFWNFSTGQRLGDLRRLVRQYGRSADAVFPVGPYWKPGSVYGGDVNLIVPLDEENNPSHSRECHLHRFAQLLLGQTPVHSGLSTQIDLDAGF